MTTTTIRLPDEMANAIKVSASVNGTTMNELVHSFIDAYLKEQDEKALYDSFTLLGQDSEASNVEFMTHAASEVVLRDE